MPSQSLKHWLSVQSKELDEIVAAHLKVRGAGPGRKYATERINHAYAVLVASNFQKFCRSLHAECVASLVSSIPTQVQVRLILLDEFQLNRQLKEKNAQEGSIGADFNRLGIEFWRIVEAGSASQILKVKRWRVNLRNMNTWRNAIAHQDFDPNRYTLSPAPPLGLQTVRTWRRSCNGLAKRFDVVMRQHLFSLTGRNPW